MGGLGWMFVRIPARTRRTIAYQPLNITDTNKTDLQRKCQIDSRSSEDGHKGLKFGDTLHCLTGSLQQLFHACVTTQGGEVAPGPVVTGAGARGPGLSSPRALLGQAPLLPFALALLTHSLLARGPGKTPSSGP